MRTRPLLAAGLVILFAGTALAGDTTYRSPNHFSIRVPEGWRRIDQATLQQTARLTGSMVGMKAPVYEAAFDREGADEPFEYPYVLVQFTEANTSGAYRDLEKQLSQSLDEAEAKHGKKLTEVIGEHSFGRPVVDKQKNRVWMSIKANGPDGSMVGVMALHLGSKGVAQLMLYTREEDAAEGRRELESMSDSFKFEDGYAFGEGGIFGGIFRGIFGKALIGGLIGLVIAIVGGIRKSRAKAQERAQSALAYEQPVTPSPFGRPVAPRKRVPAEPLTIDDLR